MFFLSNACPLFPVAANRQANVGTAATIRVNLFMPLWLPPPQSASNLRPFVPSGLHANSSSPSGTLATLREHPLHQRWFGEGQSCRTIVICPCVLGVDRASARFPPR